jgi:uncharacterized membrane protein
MSNVGTLDRIIRLIVGALFVAAPFFTTLPLWANPIAFWASIIVGAVLVATSAFSFCPIYAALGLSSKPKRLA